MTAGLLAWLVIIGAGLSLEAFAIWRQDKQWPTLTDVIKDHAPKWLVAPALGWLVWHLLAP